jgi:hypothetical protein
MRRERIRKCLISLFVIAELVILIGSTTPEIKSAIHPFGLWQTWNMFAPNPRGQDITVFANAIFKNGSERVWLPPEPIRSGFFRRHESERYHKWMSGRLLKSKFPLVLQDAATYFRQEMNDKDLPIERVELVEKWRRSSVPSDFDNADWNSEIFYHLNFPEETPK